MSIWILWLLITVIPNLVKVASVILIGGVASLAFFSVVRLIEKDEFFPTWIYTKLALPVFLVCTFIVVLVPDKEQIIYIAGGYLATNIEDIEKLPPNIVKSANKFLEDFAQEKASE